MKCMMDKRVSACLLVSIKLDSGASSGSMNQVRGPGVCAGGLGRQRGCAGAQGIHKCMRACEPRECRVCACTSEVLLLPAEEEERDLSVFMFYASPVCRYC